jgi:nitrite reductase/ring-hydroxylating ferredoxin subunit
MADLVPLPPGVTRLVHGGHVYAVFELDGETVVTDNACPHNGGPLSEGRVRDGAVVCPWHWFRFDLRTGECLTSARYALRRYQVVERDGKRYVELPAHPRRSWSEVLRTHAHGRGA